ncbi:hypothetical protein V499_00222 [Pseudogymnoascus sp. VKM F-103]|nr:hypothetical protein V499_00222 [Pseudogymnoascus sp. VKM F-103]
MDTPVTSTPNSEDETPEGRSRKRTAKAKAGYSRDTELAERIERIENLLSQKLGSEESRRDTNKSPSAITKIGTRITPRFSSSLGNLHFAGFKLREISSYNSIPLFLPEGQQWIKSRTGQTVALEKFYAFGPPWQNQRSLHMNSVPRDMQFLQDSVHLPDREIVEELALEYSSHILSLVFPTIDKVLFKDTINLAYQQGSLQPTGNASAKACIYAFLAFVSIFNVHSGGSSTGLPLDSEAYAWKAQSLAAPALQDITTDLLQTAIMLSIYQLFGGNQQSAAVMNSIAARFAFMLGAHTLHDPTIASQTSSSAEIVSRTKNHRRNLFWLCYTFDKELSLRTGQPPSMNDEHCDLTLPPGYLDRLYANQYSNSSSRDIPLFPGDLRLTMIKSRAYNSLYSARALQKSDAELLRDIRELDNDLERWRISLPLGFRPTISFSHDTPADSEMDMQVVVSRLAYHHCVAIIHEASGRCKAWADGQSSVMEGVSSSLELAVEASRSSILYLHTAQHVLEDDCFWMILFYPMSALLTIFCNILLNPLDPQAAQDLELISKAPDLIKGMPIRQPTMDELFHINLVDEFIAELRRLGKCAISKAKQENLDHNN